MFLWTFICLAQGKFFALSDLHLDIVYSGQYNSSYLCHSVTSKGFEVPPKRSETTDNFQLFCDSSYELIVSALEMMKLVDPDPDFILLTGDLVAHSTMTLMIDGKLDKEENKKKVHETLKNLSETLNDYFPNTQIIPVIGNNDAYYHYDMPKGYFKYEYLNFFTSLWKNQSLLPHTFSTDGFFSVKTRTGVNVISLNTLLVNSRQTPGLRSKVQFLWLKSQLESNDRNIIAMHIPPGFSLYKGGSQSWNDSFIQGFSDLVEGYSQKIEAIIAGHFHQGYFELIKNKFVMINPSISPLFGNNPGFRLYELENKNFYEFTLNTYEKNRSWKASSFFNRFGYPLDYIIVYEDLKSNLIKVEDFVKLVTGYLDVGQDYYLSACQAVFGDLCGSSKTYLMSLMLCGFKFLDSKDFSLCKSQIKS